MVIQKKDGSYEEFIPDKIRKAISKSAERVLVRLTDEQTEHVVSSVYAAIEHDDVVDISKIHHVVECELEEVSPSAAKSYRDYRNYKTDFVHILDEVYTKVQSIMYIGDKDNANTDSALVATRRSLIYNQLSKELYKRFFLNREELQACKDGYIYVHDMSARRDTVNCCLWDMAAVLRGGFEMGNVWYNEPNSLDTAFKVINDVILSAAAQQYGGFTVPEIDKILSPYAEKSYQKYYHEFFDIYSAYVSDEVAAEKADARATEKVKRDFEQGFQGIEYKLNTVGSSRGDYPFVTMTIGLADDKWGKMAAITMLEVHQAGQGREGNKKPVLFPKIVFLYDKELHEEGKPLHDVFKAGIRCSMKTMYPDWLSLTGEGYVPSMYKKYKKVISPMGCVDGKELVTYKFDNQLYVESFERMWARITSVIPDVGQSSFVDMNRVVDLRGANVWIYDSKKGFVRVNYLIRNVQDNWCEVRLKNGRVLTVTEDHPFETNRGAVYAKDLDVNDFIPISTTQYSEDHIDVAEDLAWLLGVMICDGSYQNYSIFVSLAAEGENDIRDRYIDAFSKHFGVVPEVIDQNREKKGKYQDIRTRSTEEHSAKTFSEYFTNLYEGVRKVERHIPPEVFSYSRRAKIAFLAGMIDADGYINNQHKHKDPTVQIGSTNKELALQQMALAQALGMPAKVYVNHYSISDKSKVRYRVEFFPCRELVDAMTCCKKKERYEPFAIEAGATSARVLCVNQYSRGNQYSYDVTTESEHFEVSGVYSHNCRAFLSPWYERGGMEPADENDVPVFVGRFNMGAISLHLPMIYAKAQRECRDFYEVLDYYLEMIRNLHKKTIDYLGEMKASVNPLAYCEGGFYGGHLNPHDKIRPLLKAATASFGITALNELQELHNGKSIAEDGEFALEVLKYINEKVAQYKKEDGVLYAIYGTPAESLCGLQVEQFRKKYGIIRGVSDRPYVSNSFHCHVTEDITPIEKQDTEGRFWDFCNGGKIQYVRYPINYNEKAVEILVKRAMELGFYEGVNLSLAYCDDCGHQELEMDVCPVCGSENLTKIDRMNGYLSYSRVHGDTRLNAAKMAEIAERKSM